MPSKERLLSVVVILIACLLFAASVMADVDQPGVIGEFGGRASLIYKRFWTETPGARTGTAGEPLKYVADGGIVDASVPVSDGGGFEPVAGRYLVTENAVVRQVFCYTVEGSDTPSDVQGSSWQYGLNDDPIFWQIGKPGGINSAYFAPTHDGVLYLEVCDDTGDWKSYSTTTDTLTWSDATVTACRQTNGTWKIYVNGVEQPVVTDGTGTGNWSALGQDLVMGAGPGFGWRCTCGDGFVDCLESCDDSGVVAGDGCSATCGIESGWQCSGEPSYCTLPCGNGVEDGVEECDDGNATLADGCSLCLVDSGFTCTGWPSVCTATCGDGVKAGAEECDDGNLVDGDGCDASCVSEGVGYWGPFSDSNYFKTSATNDPFDTAAADTNWYVCIIIAQSGTDSSDVLFDSNYSGGGVRITVQGAGYSPNLTWGGMFGLTGTGNLDSLKTFKVLAFGSNSSTDRLAQKMTGGTFVSGGWAVAAAHTSSALHLGRSSTSTGYAYENGYIKSIAVYTTGQSEVNFDACIADGADGKFDTTTNATLVCNGAEIGGTCTVGGAVFAMQGTVPYNAP